MINLGNENFCLRDGECIEISTERPTSGRFIAVMARTVQRPDGEKEETTADGLPVEDAAILSAMIRKVSQRWVWITLGPATKEAIGDLIFDNNLPKDKWLYASISEANQ
jgi:hypothetical protein